MVALYTDVPKSEHRVDPTGKVSVETPTDDANGTNFHPPTTNANNEKDHKVSDTSGTTAESIHVEAAISLIAENTSTTADPTQTTATEPYVGAADPNDAVSDATNVATDSIIPDATTDVKPRVKVSETSTTKRQSHPSLD